jgi:hypothetical protein
VTSMLEETWKVYESLFCENSITWFHCKKCRLRIYNHEYLMNWCISQSINE